MTDNRNRAETALDLAAKPVQHGPGGAEMLAAGLSLLWLLVAGTFYLMLPDRGPDEQGGAALRVVIGLLAVILPVGMVWVAAAAARSARIMRAESLRLQAAIDAMRQTLIAERQGRGAAPLPDAPERAAMPAPAQYADTPAAQPAPAERPGFQHRPAQPPQGAATFVTTRDAPRFAPHRGRAGGLATQPVPQPAPRNGPARGGEDQPQLALGMAQDAPPPLDRADLIRALNFPETDKDAAGFKALRRALRDRSARQLVHASQDVLTLLSQDGIYMDDMQPDRARPEVWRRFARGERGRSVAALGGIRDRSALGLTAVRMREDTIFRDAAHHFLRRFDQMLSGFEGEATDEDIAALAETRTARAFMLFGRVTGTFD